MLQIGARGLPRNKFFRITELFMQHIGLSVHEIAEWHPNGPRSEKASHEKSERNWLPSEECSNSRVSDLILKYQ